MVRISRWLRKEREFALRGDVDLIPTEEYTREDATRAVEDARAVVEVAKSSIEGFRPPT